MNPEYYSKHTMPNYKKWSKSGLVSDYEDLWWSNQHLIHEADKAREEAANAYKRGFNDALDEVQAVLNAPYGGKRVKEEDRIVIE